MTSYPGNAIVESARTLLTRWVNRGNRPRMLPDGKIVFGGPVTDLERRWAFAHRDAIVIALIGGDHYTPGTLDAALGIRPMDESEREQR